MTALSKRDVIRPRAMVIPWLALVAASILTAAGCGGGSATDSAAPNGGGSGSMALSGIVHGGQNPVSGAQVFVYQAGISGSGAGDRQLACTITNTVGQFSFGSTSTLCAGTALPAALACPTTGSALIYLIAAGGNPGAGINSALVMMTALGNCNALPTGLTVTINELTTAAAVTALSRFTSCSNTPGTSCPATARDLGSSATNQTGLVNSMVVVGNLANLGTGLAQTSNGGTSRPSGFLNTLADIIQDCVNSTGAASSACNNLFTCVVPGATPGAGNLAPCTVPAGATVPADTLTAVLDIARNPVNNVATLFNLTSKTPAFTPSLATPPNSWAVSLNYAGPLLGPVRSIAIDAAGDAWVVNPFPAAINTVLDIGPSGGFRSNYAGGGIIGPVTIAIDPAASVWVGSDESDAVTEISSSGVFLSGVNGFMGGGMLAPQQIAIDSAGNAWLADGSNRVIDITPAGTFLSGANGFTGGGLNLPFGIALDAKGDAWITNSNGNSLTEFNSGGGLVSPNSGCPGTANCGYTGGGLNRPLGIAIDPSGNAWVANAGGNSVTEISQAGKFVSPSSGCPGTSNCGFRGGGLDNPSAIAIDSIGDAWVTNDAANITTNTLTEIASTGRFLSPAAGFIGAGLNAPSALAIDAGGNIWIANEAGHSVTEFVGLAPPVLTPAASCLKLNTGHAVCVP